MWLIRTFTDMVISIIKKQTIDTNMKQTAFILLQPIERWSFIVGQNSFHSRSQTHQSWWSDSASSLIKCAEWQRVTLGRCRAWILPLVDFWEAAKTVWVKWYSWAARVPPWHSGAAVSRTARTSGLRLSLAALHLHVLLPRADLLVLPARLPLGDSDSEANWWLSNCPWFECERECYMMNCGVHPASGSSMHCKGHI